ncbi:MAG TPA: SAM-dependent methyltransferase [Pyrinomonadaceae bacterium]|nr:SAM-dependent methyltransferase [Pyrinomonadaceae bacterium]
MIEATPTTSTLSERLRERIRSEGPITFCDWMKAALYDESEGYYCRPNSNPWGREGDYRTSPERSALFAMTFARYFAALHESLGRPAKWIIVEAGAGEGSFAGGVLKTLRDFFPEVFSATHYIIDEINSEARAVVGERLKVFADRIEFGSLRETQLNPNVVFSNELFDAFPVHRVILSNGELREFYVDIGLDDNFVWKLGPTSSERIVKYFEENEIHLVESQVAEVNLTTEDWLRHVSRKLTRGYLITVDYGLDANALYSPTERMEGTLRGFSSHRHVEDLLADPGEQDLTATVNWTFVQHLGAKLGLRTVNFERQDKFLLSAGLLTQLQLESARAADDAERLSLTTAAREMILPGGMATSFQVLVQERELVGEG